jgi:hypothetical protein
LFFVLDFSLTKDEERIFFESLGGIFNPRLILFHYLWVSIPNTELCREDFTQQGG